MGGRGGGRSFGPRINYEQFGLSKEDFAGTNVVPPPAYPARAPCPPPEDITPSVSYMLDVGASIKETIRARMMAGEFSVHLGVPRELLEDGASLASKKKSKKKKKKGKATMAHLDALATNEDEADSDAEKAEDDAESESGEEHDSDEEDSEDSDDELDENNDYTHNYYDDEEQEDAGLSDEEYNEAMA